MNNIIDPKIKGIESVVRPIDDSILLELTQLALRCKKGTEVSEIRKDIYKSKYKANNLERKESELAIFLQKISGSNIKTQDQNKDYKWININTDKMGDIRYRFYIAPNPENMHEIVKKLVEAFKAQNVPVRFKYQLTKKMEECDRIIIYSDNNRKLVEHAIKSVYQSSPSLFKGCERSPAWLYDSEVPGVYFAPETPGDAYGNRVCEAVLEAREVFNFLYGITNSNSRISLEGKEADQAVEYMKLLITSMLVREGILLSKNGGFVNITGKKINTYYDYDTGILENWSSSLKEGYFSVKFHPTIEGKKALLENFYSVSNIRPQKGLETKYLTPEQRKEDLNRALYSKSNNLKK